ncbi:hypothetical protein [Rhodobacter maris]|uniref:Pantothenate kinase n=1 Tax=Rhodobacter maris TaxID=446682 RepID=A0A285RX36_9RHOB|nr:hypothetical protein [Rhodobacter maris]SOB99039.1 hypothetical protein SAMN05877831_102105 [Rhodobacter maris]
MAEFWLGDSNGPMGDVGAFMASELRVDRADLAGHIGQLGPGRVLVAIVGAPGSGKSRLARELAEALNAKAPGMAAVLPMDGFHRDNDWLEAHRLRAVKGAPETFDVEALLACLCAVKTASEDLPVPSFDRAADEVVPGGATIPAGARVVLVEGNYLLLTRAPWRDLFPLFDLSIRIAVPEATLRARLMNRWASLPEAEARRRTEENDLPNGRLLAQENRAADLVIAAP